MARRAIVDGESSFTMTLRHHSANTAGGAYKGICFAWKTNLSFSFPSAESEFIRRRLFDSECSDHDVRPVEPMTIFSVYAHALTNQRIVAARRRTDKTGGIEADREPLAPR